jgi:hypothetical protein
LQDTISILVHHSRKLALFVPACWRR